MNKEPPQQSDPTFWYFVDLTSQKPEQRGPVPEEYLRSQLSAGNLPWQTPVRRDGMENWAAAENLFQPHPNPAQPAPDSSKPFSNGNCQDAGIGRTLFIFSVACLWISGGFFLASYPETTNGPVLGLFVCGALTALSYLRLKSIGYPTWLALLSFAPLVNVFFLAYISALPRHYASCKKSDPAMIGIFATWVFLILGLIVTILLLLKPTERNASHGPKGFTIPDQGIRMIWIPSGEFLMGGPFDENDPYATPVILTEPFWIGETEITQAQWSSLMDSNPSYWRGLDLPVESVSWHEAMAFCRRLTEQERRAGRLPEGHHYTLPSEAQWEYSARAGTTTKWSFGDDENLLDLYAWTDDQTHPVRQKQPTAWGLYDIYGNAFEWTRSWLDKYPGARVIDYEGPPLGSQRVFRGISDWPSTARSSHWPLAQEPQLGLRVVLCRQ